MERYGLDMTLSPPESSDEDEYDDEEVSECSLEIEIPLKSLLDSAVLKRYELDKRRGENLRCEMLQTRFIVKLYRHIEQKEKRKRSSSSGTSSGSSDDGEVSEVPDKKRRSLEGTEGEKKVVNARG